MLLGGWKSVVPFGPLFESVHGRIENLQQYACANVKAEQEVLLTPFIFNNKHSDIWKAAIPQALLTLQLICKSSKQIICAHPQRRMMSFQVTIIVTEHN